MTITKNDPIGTECKNIELIPLAQDRNHIRVFVCTVMKLGVSYYAGNLLIS